MELCGFEVGLDRPFFLIAGPCVIESEALSMETAGQLKEIAAALDAAIAQTPPGETLYIVPTYTAMLEVRELLAKRGKRRPFWEER